MTLRFQPFLNLIFPILLLFSTCAGRHSKPEADHSSISNELPDDFSRFYQQFHKDSLFQIDHIQWPLAGISNKKEKQRENFSFQREDWTMHRPFDPETTGFYPRFTLLSDDLIEERIVDRQNTYGLMRRWMRIGEGDWLLIFYQEPMPIQN